MAEYIQFTSADNSTLLVEVEEEELSSQRGVQKAGLREVVDKQVAIALTSLEDAMQQAIRYNAQAFIKSISGMAILPSEAEITFGLKVTGEAGNVAVGKVGGETNYAVKLTWKREER